ncbi:MAG: Asp/Glu racemase [Dehalococcoidia bacterium]
MGIRKRIGLMMPAADSTAEPDFQMVFAAKEITVHTHRLWDAADPEPQARFDGMNSEIETAIRYLARVKPDAIAYCCTTGSFYRGPGWDQEMVRLIERASGVPAVATSPSVVDALNAFGAKKLSVITPYGVWANEKLEAYLGTLGFEVLNLDAHPETASGAMNMCDQDPEEVVEFGVRMCRPEADALLCSCTGWRALEAVEELENLTGKPVVTANQATIWTIIRKLGITEPVRGYGKLLEDLTVVPTR